MVHGSIIIYVCLYNGPGLRRDFTKIATTPNWVHISCCLGNCSLNEKGEENNKIIWNHSFIFILKIKMWYYAYHRHQRNPLNVDILCISFCHLIKSNDSLYTNAKSWSFILQSNNNRSHILIVHDIAWAENFTSKDSNTNCSHNKSIQFCHWFKVNWI